MYYSYNICSFRYIHTDTVFIEKVIDLMGQHSTLLLLLLIRRSLAALVPVVVVVIAAAAVVVVVVVIVGSAFAHWHSGSHLRDILYMYILLQIFNFDCTYR